MNEVIIRIIDTDNNVLGDLDLTNFNDFPLAINKGIVNLDNLKERTGTFTKMFKVPNSKNNTNLLSNVDNINSRKDFRDCLNKKPCIILINNNPVEHGFVQVVKAFNDIEGGYFELVFYGDNIDWVKDASDLKLNTIAWRNNYQKYAQDDINVFNAGNSTTYDFAYPYISRGGNAITDRTDITDYLPCIYMPNLINACFKDLGYNVESSFLSDISTLVCDLGLKLEQSEADIENSKVRASLTSDLLDYGEKVQFVFNDDTTFPNIDNGSNYNNLLGSYTVPQSGVYNVKVSVITKDWFVSGTDDKVLGIALASGSGYSLGFNTFIKDSEIKNVSISGEVRTDYNLSAKLEEGELVTIFHEWNVNPFTSGGESVKFKSGTYFTCQLTSAINEGDYFTASKLIPDSIKFLDILNDFTRMFNIYYWTDVKTKTVYFEPRDNFFESKTTAIDWSEKLDTSKGYNVDYVSSYKRNINFNYKEDRKDGYLEKWNIFNKKTYGKYTHQLPNRFSKGSTDISLDFFAPTYAHKALEVSGLVGFTTLKIWNEYKTDGNTPEERNEDYKPRVFFFNNAAQLSDDGFLRSIHVKNGDVTTVQNTIPYGIFETYFNIEPHFNLNFANGLKADETTDIGLFERFYSKMFKNIEEGGRIVAYFDLNSTDIQNLDFRQLIYLEGDSNVEGYYLIEKVIDYNPLSSELTKVSLFKFEDLGSVSIDGSQTGNNDSDTDDGLTPPTLQPIYVENGALLTEVYIENPITGLIEPVYK